MDPFNRSGAQTTRNFAWRDYGNRVGNWRLFDILDELKLPAIDPAQQQRFATSIRRSSRRSSSAATTCCGHGRTNAEVLRGMWEHDEARAIQECIEIIAKHVGVRPTGWMGPGALESSVTPDLLKEAGYTHLLDWPVDDQPIWMRRAQARSCPFPIRWN